MRFQFARRRAACIGVAALLVAVTPTTYSATPPIEPTGTLTLSGAIAATLSRNPDLAFGDYELKAADARKLQAGLRPNPDVAVDVGGFAGSGLARGDDERQATLMLSQVLELGDKRTRRVNVAESDRALVGIEQQARELDVLSDVTRRFIDVVADQEQVTFSQGALDLAERTERAIGARVQAARTPQAELSRSRIAVTRARIDVRQAQNELNAAKRTLAAMWGGTDARFERAQADLYALPPVESFEALRQRLDRNPDFLRLASESRLRDGQIRLEQARARPNLTLSAGIRRFHSTGDIGLVAGFSIPIPVRDRNQGAIAEARVRSDQTQSGERAARIRVQAQLFALYSQVEASREQLAIFRMEATPQAQAALEQTQYGYDRGRFSYLELAAAQQDLLSLQVAAIGVATDIHRLTAEIERLTGEPLATGTSQDSP